MKTVCHIGLTIILAAFIAPAHGQALSSIRDSDLSLQPGVGTALAKDPLYLQTKPTDSQASQGDIAKKLSNPVSLLINVPLQSNFDFNTGVKDGWRYTLNVQPVIPFRLTDDFNLITRTIVPVIYQDDVVKDGSFSQFGLGDTTQTFFIATSHSKPIVGIGPVFVWPTATNDTLGSGKWGAGPSAIVVAQDGPWTYGLLSNHIWSYAGNSSGRPSTNATLLQPFVAYNTKTGFGLTLQTESSYDWNASQWTVPVGLFASQVLRIDGQAVSISAGPRVYVEGPHGAPSWGLRFSLTFVFPE